MSADTVDLFVIGAGSGGVRAARTAAQRGARVIVAEPGPLGGTCVNVGCVPKKLYSHAAHFADDFRDARGFGWQLEAPVFDWATLKSRRAAEITRLNGIYGNVLATAGATLVRGRARLAGPQAVEVDGQRWQARHILVATGGRASRPDIPGGELAVNSDAMFDLPAFPRRLVVVGGGYIASEMASIFHGLGAEVVQLVRGPRLLRGFDDDVAAFLGQEMQKKGVQIRFGTRPLRIERHGAALRVVVDAGAGSDGATETIAADTVLWATGRVPHTAGLGLAEAGVRLDAAGAIVVDAHYASSVPTIHALGDVTHRLQLTPVATAEAMALVDHLFGDGRRRVDYEHVPTAVFTHPNVGTVGLSEAQARERYGRLRLYRSEFKALKHTLSDSTERTLLKLVVDDASDRVVGVHMVGADAGEIVQGFAVALRAGATKAVFDGTIGIHPTVAEEFVTMRDGVVA